jgi:hypothetical protein
LIHHLSRSPEAIKKKLKTYKKYIDPQKYKTLHKQIKISEQQNERALARLNTRVIKGFAKDLTGYTNCVTTNNCSPETAVIIRVFADV